MGKAFTVVTAGVAGLAASIIGLLLAGGIAFVAGQFPAFHWEMAGLSVTAVAAVTGMIVGAWGAASGRTVIGMAVGASLGGLAFLGLSIGDQHPAVVTFWGTIAVAASASLAGVTGAAIGKRFVLPSPAARR